LLPRCVKAIPKKGSALIENLIAEVGISRRRGQPATLPDEA